MQQQQKFNNTRSKHPQLLQQKLNKGQKNFLLLTLILSVCVVKLQSSFASWRASYLRSPTTAKRGEQFIKYDEELETKKAPWRIAAKVNKDEQNNIDINTKTTNTNTGDSNFLYDPTRYLCYKNPYASALEDSLSIISRRAKEWYDNADTILYNLQIDPETPELNHKRFDVFEIMAPCRSEELTCVGGKCGDDPSKIMCGLNALDEKFQDVINNAAASYVGAYDNDALRLVGGFQAITKPKNTTTAADEESSCIIYSIGGNNQWEFERDMLKKTNCQIHTFDCTGHRIRFWRKPFWNAKRLHFHHVCLGTEYEPAPTYCNGFDSKCGETWTLQQMQDKLQHKRIDLLKMDIEGFEWPLFESWPELSSSQHYKSNSNNLILPKQLMVEIHYQTQFESLFKQKTHEGGHWRDVNDLVRLQKHLLKVGYVVTARDDNVWCPHCTELTLMQVHCDES